MAEENIQAKLMRFQMLQRQLEALESEKKQILNKKSELDQTKETLDGISESGKKEIFSPLGSGSFAFAKLTDSEHILTSLGAGVACKKTIPEAKRILDGRSEELEKVLKELGKNLKSITQEMEKMRPELEKASQ